MSGEHGRDFDRILGGEDLISDTDLSKATVIQMADLPDGLAAGYHLAEFVRADLAVPVFRYAGPALDDGMLAYLSRVVSADIRKRSKSVAGFAPRPGQSEAEASEVLAHFQAGVDFRRDVLGRLADLTADADSWRASAVTELPDDEDGPEDCGTCGHPVRHGSGATVTCDVCGSFCCEAHHRVSPRYSRHDLTGVQGSDRSEDPGLPPYVTPEVLTAARSWIGECEWGDLAGEGDIADLTDAQVIAGIRAHYAGGLSQFLEDSNL